jgi:serine protease Do
MRPIDLFDDYLNGELGTEELAAFKQRLAADETFARAFKEHKSLVHALKQHSNRETLKKQLKAIHNSEFGSARIVTINQESTARRFGKTAMIAASTALVAVLGTVAVLSMGGYLLKQQSSQITELGLQIKATNDGIVEGISRGSQKAVSAPPANLEGSAFALNNKGYLITSFHMVNGADSVFIQNSAVQRTLAKVVLTDPKLDLAVLKIEDASLTKTWQVPFTIREKSTEIGEKVFTLGYPRKDMVYGEGSLSSLSGYSNDTTMYQISIPVNPGNSGGPLLDEQGNVIGVIRGKITTAEATGFAIKANEILKSIRSMDTDSTTKQELLSYGKKPVLKNLKRSEQVKRIHPYVFNVLVYKGE